MDLNASSISGGKFSRSSEETVEVLLLDWAGGFCCADVNENEGVVCEGWPNGEALDWLDEPPPNAELVELEALLKADAALVAPNGEDVDVVLPIADGCVLFVFPKADVVWVEPNGDAVAWVEPNGDAWAWLDPKADVFDWPNGLELLADVPKAEPVPPLPPKADVVVVEAWPNGLGFEFVVVPNADGWLLDDDEPKPVLPNPDEVFLFTNEPKGRELALLFADSRNPVDPNPDRPNPLDVVVAAAAVGLFAVPNPLEPNALPVVEAAGLFPNPLLPNPEEPNAEVVLELPNPVDPNALDVLLGFPNPELPNPDDCDDDDDGLLVLLVLNPDDPNPLLPNPELDEFVANGFDWLPNAPAELLFPNPLDPNALVFPNIWA